MFKSITAFKIGDRATKLALLNPDLAELLEEHGAPSPHATQWCRYGFSKPSCFGSSFAFDGAMGARVLCIRRSERILPGTVIKQELAVRVKRIEEKEGRHCHRKEIASMKDDVIANLLPKAFIKNTDYKVLIAGDYVMFDCTSVKMVDEMVATLIDAIVGNGLVSTLRLQLVQGRDVAKWLKGIALDEYGTNEFGQPISRFQHLDSAVLKGDGVVRLKDLEFDTDVGVAALGSKMHFQELAVGWGAEPGEIDLHCCINDSLLIKRLKFSDVLLKQAKEDSDEDEVSYFDATVAIAADLLVKMFDSIVEAVGVDDDEEENESEGLDVLGAAIKRGAEALKDFTITTKDAADVPEGDGSERDYFYPQAKQYVIETQKASISALQRKLRIGYNRAARLMETLEWNEVVSEPDENGVRQVLEEDDEL